MKLISKLSIVVLSSVGIAVGLEKFISTNKAIRSKTVVGYEVATPTKVAVPDAAVFARPHLDTADARIEKSLDDQIEKLRLFFEKSKRNVPTFVNDSLGWNSKYHMTRDLVPFSSGGRHATYIRNSFNANVFRAHDLEQEISQAVSAFIADMESIESKMLVDVQVDIDDLPLLNQLQSNHEDKIRAHFDEAMKNGIAASHGDVRTMIGTEFASQVTAFILRKVIASLCVSGAVLGVGSAGAPGTFGATLVAGLVIDVVISSIWDWVSNPRGELAAKVNQQIDQISHVIRIGDGSTPGLKGQLCDIAKARSELRKKVLIDQIQKTISGAR